MTSMTQPHESAWQRYLLPAFSFMSVVIGGGYATGRELVEFFMPAGPIGGLAGMAVAALIWSLIFGLSLEFARSTNSYEYQSFFRHLLGPAWVLFEVAYLVMLLLVVAVLGAASGAMIGDLAGTPLWFGTALFVVLVALLAWSGTAAIERFFSAWGVALFCAYALLLVVALIHFGGRIGEVLSNAEPARDWLEGGVVYAGYNLAAMPALLFCARHLTTRRDAVVAGALAGPIAMIPGALLYLALLASYPQILTAPIPLHLVLRALDLPWLATAMQIAIFGTLVQTGVGMLHGFNERLAPVCARHTRLALRTWRVVVSVAVLLIAIVLAGKLGIIDLIAKGYAHISWVIIAVYVIPLLSVGLWRLRTTRTTP
jgi:uncharacterized membrane protein YkvI